MTSDGPRGRLLFDRGTGWRKHGTRWNDTITGRWTTQDPITRLNNPNRANPYQYADCDPINNTDPTGRSIDWGNLALQCTQSAIMDLGFSFALGLVTGGTSVIATAVLGCVQGAGIEYLSNHGQEEIAAALNGYLTADQVAEILRGLSL